MGLLRAIQIVTVGLWVGVGLFFSLVVAPQVFSLFTGTMVKSPPEGLPQLDERVGRRFAGETVGVVFPWYFGVQAALALAALASTAILLWRGTGSRFLWVEFLLVLVACLGLLVQLAWVYPASERVLSEIHRLEAAGRLDQADQLRSTFGMWHGISQLCNLITVGGAALAFVTLAWELSRTPEHGQTKLQSGHAVEQVSGV